MFARIIFRRCVCCNQVFRNNRVDCAKCIAWELTFMKRRYNCRDGKIEKARPSQQGKPGQQETSVPGPETAGSEADASWSVNKRPSAPDDRSRGKARPRRDTRLRHPWIPAHRHLQENGEQIEHPESPWDRRLRHPWVWAYRRVHGHSGVRS